MQFENLKAIIDFAIEKEKEAAEFYESIAKEESAAGSKNMYKEFALEEKKHQTLLENIDKKGVALGLADYKFKWITDIKRSDYTVAMEYGKNMAYNEILMIAMKREENALKLYNTLLENTDNPEQKTVFKVLCQEEAKHKLALETLYDDYMAKMGD
jgi:rubrerythrin